MENDGVYAGTGSAPPPSIEEAGPRFGQDVTGGGAGRRWLWIGLISLAVLGLVGGCGMIVRSVSRGQEEARSLLKDLHLQMIRSDWDGIYAEAAPEYRDALTREKNAAIFGGLVRKLGTPVSSVVDGMQVNATTSGTYLRASFKTAFSADATGIETVVWKDVDGQYLLVRYDVNSAELLER